MLRKSRHVIYCRVPLEIESLRGTARILTFTYLVTTQLETWMSDHQSFKSKL